MLCCLGASTQQHIALFSASQISIGAACTCTSGKYIRQPDLRRNSSYTGASAEKGATASVAETIIVKVLAVAVVREDFLDVVLVVVLFTSYAELLGTNGVVMV